MDRIRLVHTDTLSCEAILRRAPNGELFIVSQCGGLAEPSPDNRVYVFHSKDNGETWSEKQPIAPDNGRAQYQTEVAVVGEEILVFMTEHDGNFTSFRHYVLSSRDNGYTFTEKCDFTLKKGFCFVRGMVKVGEKYLFPYQNYPVSEEKDAELVREGKKIWHCGVPFVENGVFATSDFQNFTLSEKEVKLPLVKDGKPRWVWSEPTVAEINGKLMMLMRFDGRNFLHKSVSEDGGKSWSEAVATDIPNPGNKSKLIPLGGGKVALLNTPKSGSRYIERQPLALWITEDGEKWYYKRDIVTFPGWLSYPDGIASEDGKHVLFAFEFNRHDVYFVDAEI